MPRWTRVLEECAAGNCREAREFLESLCRDRSECAPSRGGAARYEWVEAIIRRGVPDGRSRLILYVISRYLVNIRGLSDDEALAEVQGFLQASCSNYGNCSKIYTSWIRNVLKHVRRGGWRPWSLERMRREDPELYSIIEKVVGLGGNG
ncbi:MAG: DNA primase noncatalytic subunit PriX [Desulfurococcales archaeon]|nr:DNA primase noncatalytic subunit PriX [Desulfurococcales archaeon]